MERTSVECCDCRRSFASKYSLKRHRDKGRCNTVSHCASVVVGTAEWKQQRMAEEKQSERVLLQDESADCSVAMTCSSVCAGVATRQRMSRMVARLIDKDSVKALLDPVILFEKDPLNVTRRIHQYGAGRNLPSEWTLILGAPEHGLSPAVLAEVAASSNSNSTLPAAHSDVYRLVTQHERFVDNIKYLLRVAVQQDVITQWPIDLEWFASEENVRCLLKAGLSYSRYAGWGRKFQLSRCVHRIVRYLGYRLSVRGSSVDEQPNIGHAASLPLVLTVQAHLNKRRRVEAAERALIPGEERPGYLSLSEFRCLCSKLLEDIARMERETDYCGTVTCRIARVFQSMTITATVRWLRALRLHEAVLLANHAGGCKCSNVSSPHFVDKFM